MILTYNDLFRAGAGFLVEFNGHNSSLTAWGLAITNELWKRGYEDEDIREICGVIK